MLRGPVLLLLVAVGLLLGGAAPALAAEPATIARALAESPLYVDPSLTDAVPDAQRRAVLRAIDAAPYPVYVALVPLTAGDRFGGKAERFLNVIHGRLERDGIYVTVADRVLSQREYGTDAEQDAIFQASTVGNFESGNFDEPEIEKVRRFVAVLGDPQLEARAAKVERRLEARRTESPRSPVEPGEDAKAGGRPGAVVIVLASLVLLAVAAAAIRGWRRRYARPAPTDEPLVPRRIFEHARTARAEELREEIEERLVAFSTEIDARPTPHRPEAIEAQQRGLDAYTAARRVLQSDPEMVDLVGALVLVHDGAQALERAAAHEAGRPAPRPAPLCFFDPRHGTATDTVTRELGVPVPVCATCRRDLNAGATPAPLLDDGEPWFEGDSVWAQTGFGVFTDKLAGRVLTRGLRR